MLKLFAHLSVLVAVFSSGAAMAASGKALGVDPAAEARGNETRTLVVGADIFIGDRVVTGPQGQVQIMFEDRTELVVGPRSALLIEDYLLRDDGSAGRLAVNALSGTFRFVTGGAPKDRYSIATPTGTIGVRGTSLDLTVVPGMTNVLLYNGAVRICSNSGECVELTAKCEAGQFDSRNATVIGQTNRIDADESADLKALFDYANSQRPLLREFRVSGAEGCFRRSAGSGGGSTLSDTGTSEGDPSGSSSSSSGGSSFSP
jgi:hypothetical protein